MPTLHVILIAALFEKTDLVLAAGLTMVISGLVWSYKKRRRTQASHPTLTPNEQIERNRQMRGVRGDLESLMVEIEQFSKRLSSHLDAKAAAMEMLLKQVDTRIAELKRLTGNGQSTGSGTSAQRHEKDIEDDDPFREPPQPAEPAKHRSAPSAQLPEDALSRSVYQLADQGLDAYTIAQRLQEHVGKIELILALRTA